MPPPARKKRAVEGAEPAQTKAKKPRASRPPPAAARPPPRPERCDALGKRVVFRPRASEEVYTKMQRALPGSGHRIFLISREKQAADKETFTVLGAKADVYKVVIGRQPSCNCMDARTRRNLCKHHMFVMLRVLGLAVDDPRVWQKALTQAEAEEVLGGAERALGGVLADDAVRRAYMELSGKPVRDLKAAAQQAKQRPLDSNDCPICFDALSAQEAVVWCTTCGNNVHEQCFGMWVSQRAKQGADAVCVFCRAMWPVSPPDNPKSAAKKPRARAVARPSTIVNLFDVSQAHQAADLSARALYGPRRQDEEYYAEYDE